MQFQIIQNFLITTTKTALGKYRKSSLRKFPSLASIQIHSSEENFHNSLLVRSEINTTHKTLSDYGQSHTAYTCIHEILPKNYNFEHYVAAGIISTHTLPHRKCHLITNIEFV